MQVCISVGARFHAFDLAWQMQKRGFLRRLITSYPKFKVKEWGIENQKIRTVISHELLTRGWKTLAQRFRLKADPQFHFNSRYDRIASRYIPADTDVFVGWSSMSVRSIRRAKQLNARTVLERNSTHIVYQRNILMEEYSRFGVQPQLPDPRMIDRELQEYDEVDYICVPGSFAYQSFIQQGVPKEKLLQVPFGVDATNFYPIPKKDSTFRIIHAGALTIRKGVHYLLQAFHELALKNSELWLIGSPSAEIVPFLNKYGGSHVVLRGTFPQSKLYEQYSQGSVFCLASIEEGFAMVISQAMACSLPVVCTTSTTGHDIIRENIDGFVVPIRDVEAIKNRIALLYEDQELCRSMGQAARKQILSNFTWDHYGETMAKVYARIQNGSGNHFQGVRNASENQQVSK